MINGGNFVSFSLHKKIVNKARKFLLRFIFLILILTFSLLKTEILQCEQEENIFTPQHFSFKYNFSYEKFLPLSLILPFNFISQLSRNRWWQRWEWNGKYKIFWKCFSLSSLPFFQYFFYLSPSLQSIKQGGMRWVVKIWGNFRFYCRLL